MCPVCLTTAALAVAGATTAGGLTALTVKVLRVKAGLKVSRGRQKPRGTR